MEQHEELIICIIVQQYEKIVKIQAMNFRETINVLLKKAEHILY